MHVCEEGPVVAAGVDLDFVVPHDERRPRKLGERLGGASVAPVVQPGLGLTNLHDVLIQRDDLAEVVAVGRVVDRHAPERVNAVGVVADPVAKLPLGRLCGQPALPPVQERHQVAHPGGLCVRTVTLPRAEASDVVELLLVDASVEEALSVGLEL